jgi:deazaflavin-dependent oxidoreductase (nitroreductase family)
VIAVRRNPIVMLAWRLHRWIYQVSGGRLGFRLGAMRVLLLTTRGRRSGKLHRVALNYFEDDQGQPVIVASYAGEDRHPAWYLNLEAHSVAEAQIRRERRRVTARTTIGAERERLWTRLVKIDPSYAVYERRTARQIPVVVLEPGDDAA